MNKKQWVKIGLLSAPIIALVIASLAGLDENAQKSINDVIVQIVIVLGGIVGVTGVVVNNDKDEQ